MHFPKTEKGREGTMQAADCSGQGVYRSRSITRKEWVVRAMVAGLVAAHILVGCGVREAPAAPSAERDPGTTQAATAPRGSLRIAWGPEPAGLDPKLLRAGPADIGEMSAIFTSPLTIPDPSGAYRPLLARTLPSQENGGLVVHTDGTMVTTYRLREHAKWHDGTPLTAGDLAFAAQVYGDPEIPVSDRASQGLMASVAAPDAHSLVITWRQPYFLATRLSYRELLPLPRHLLEEAAQTDKASFGTGPEWTSNFVSNGPFRVAQWEPGVRLVAQAFPAWLLGPPKLERLEIRFIRDPNTVLATLLAGEADFTMSDFIHTALAVSAREQWVDGGLGYLMAADVGVQYVVFQFREVANWQRAVTDLRVRQALLHATDRDGLADVVTAGVGAPAHLFLFRSHPAFPAVDRATRKYPYDPGRAAALLAEAGWQRDPGQPLLRGTSGEPLAISYWRSAGGGAEQDLSLVVDNWRRLGIDSDGFIIPAARANDAEFIVSFPGVLASSRPVNPESFVFTSDQRPTPEKRWQGINRGSFQDPEIDRLQNLVLRLIHPTQWEEAIVALHQRMQEAVGAAPLYYRPRLIMVRNQVTGPHLNPGSRAVMWNVFEWELKD